MPSVGVSATPVPSPKATPVPTPTPPEAPLYSFAVVGGSAGRGGDDGVLCAENLDAALSTAKDNSADFVLVLGDMATGSVFGDIAGENLRAFLAAARKHFDEIDIYPVYGLHESHHKGRNKFFTEEDDRNDPDNADMVEKEYKLTVFGQVFDGFKADSFCHKVYGRTVYAFTEGDCNFFVLNTKWYEHMDRISPTVIDWMDEYAENGAAYNFIFMYGTPYPISDVGLEMDADFSTTTDDLQTMTNAEFRDEFMAALKELDHPVLFCGAEAMYARREADGIPQLSVSGMGYEFDTVVNDGEDLLCDPVYENHCLVAHVYKDRVEFTAYAADTAEVIDRFTIKETD